MKKFLLLLAFVLFCARTPSKMERQEFLVTQIYHTYTYQPGTKSYSLHLFRVNDSKEFLFQEVNCTDLVLVKGQRLKLTVSFYKEDKHSAAEKLEHLDIEIQKDSRYCKQ